MPKFYIICQIGFEEELVDELKEFWPFLIDKDGRNNITPLIILEIGMGGVLIECSEILGYQINFFSKIATRVLERVSEFKVKDFPKLKTKLDKISLNDYFDIIDESQLEIAASKSRLNNEKRILEVVKESWLKQKSKSGQRGQAKLSIYIRLYDDLCTISVDTSGEPLYKRNSELKYVGEAPIRETCAAFMSRKLIKNNPLTELKKIELFDLTVGSGTLLFEFRNLYLPSLSRDFAFFYYKKAPKLLKSDTLSQNYRHRQSLGRHFYGFDIDKTSLVNLNKNLDQNKILSQAKSDFTFEILDSTDIKKLWSTINTFNSNKEISADDGTQRWLISNPPYGERIKGFSMEKFLECINELEFKKIGLLLPSHFSKLIKSKLSHFKFVEGHHFKNGGLPVQFFIFEKTF